MRSILQINGEINEDIRQMIHAEWLKWRKVLVIVWIFANTPPHIQQYWDWCVTLLMDLGWALMQS